MPVQFQTCVQPVSYLDFLLSSPRGGRGQLKIFVQVLEFVTCNSEKECFELSSLKFCQLRI